MPQHVRVVPPDPAWAEGYRRERALLMPVFGPLLVELHHIGSTAVEGLWAKPILDLMPVVTSLEAVDRLDPELEALGYQWGVRHPGQAVFPQGRGPSDPPAPRLSGGRPEEYPPASGGAGLSAGLPGGAGGLWGAEAVAGRTVPGGH